jgi:hypothetical protein
MQLHKNTDQVINKGQSESTGQSTLWSDNDKYDFDYQQEIHHRGQVRHDRELRTTMVPLWKKWYNADTVISHIVLPNSWNPASSMVPPALHHQRSTFLNKWFKTDCTLPMLALPLPKPSADKNVPQPKASRDQNATDHQNITFELVKRLMERIIIAWTPWPIISNDKHPMAENAWKLAIDVQDCQWVSAGACIGTPSGWQLPHSPALEIDLPRLEAVSREFGVVLFYQTWNIDYAPKYK